MWSIGIGGKKVSTKDKRWYKEVGLGFKTPSEAINGTYIGTPIMSLVGVYVPGLIQCQSS